MMHLSARSRLVRRGQPVVVLEPKRDEYSFGYVIRHGLNWRRMRPEQRASVLLAAAAYLEAEAAGMREQADAFVQVGGRSVYRLGVSSLLGQAGESDQLARPGVRATGTARDVRRNLSSCISVGRAPGRASLFVFMRSAK